MSWHCSQALVAPRIPAIESGLLPTPTTSESRNATRPNREASPYHAGTTLMDWTEQVAGLPRRRPSFEEWMMLWPIGWTDSRPLAMDKFRQWLEQHGSC